MGKRLKGYINWKKYNLDIVKNLKGKKQMEPVSHLVSSPCPKPNRFLFLVDFVLDSVGMGLAIAYLANNSALGDSCGSSPLVCVAFLCALYIFMVIRDIKNGWQRLFYWSNRKNALHSRSNSSQGQFLGDPARPTGNGSGILKNTQSVNRNTTGSPSRTGILFQAVDKPTKRRTIQLYASGLILIILFFWCSVSLGDIYQNHCNQSYFDIFVNQKRILVANFIYYYWRIVCLIGMYIWTACSSPSISEIDMILQNQQKSATIRNDTDMGTEFSDSYYDDDSVAYSSETTENIAKK